MRPELGPAVGPALWVQAQQLRKSQSRRGFASNGQTLATPNPTMHTRPSGHTNKGRKQLTGVTGFDEGYKSVDRVSWFPFATPK